jgi:hypothetical protein
MVFLQSFQGKTYVTASRELRRTYDVVDVGFVPRSFFLSLRGLATNTNWNDKGTKFRSVQPNEHMIIYYTVMECRQLTTVPQESHIIESYSVR